MNACIKYVAIALLLIFKCMKTIFLEFLEFLEFKLIYCNQMVP